MAKKLRYNLTVKEKDEFVMCLLGNNFNVARTCAELGRNRAEYYYLIKHDKDFKDRLDHGHFILKSTVLNGLLEGLEHADLTLRYKYLDLLAKSGILVKVLGFDNDNKEVKLVFDKNNIKLT